MTKLFQNFQFDFLEPRNVTGIKTKGGDYGWVKSYEILYSADNVVWNKVQTESGTPRLFLANVDGDSPKVNYFKYPLHARYVKIIPVKWHETIEMKIEPIGCFTPYRK